MPPPPYMKNRWARKKSSDETKGSSSSNGTKSKKKKETGESNGGPVPSSQASDKGNAKKSSREYIPKPGSGPYAILIAFQEAYVNDGKSMLLKNELQNRAQPYSTDSMTIPKPGSHYTAWSSMKGLVEKGYIERHMSRYASYSLTESGRDLAEKLWTIKHRLEGTEAPTITTQLSQETTSDVSIGSFTLEAGTFDIILIIDTRESSSGVAVEDRKTALLDEMLADGIKAEMRALPVGDFTWIARPKNDPRGNQKELLLDRVIERKRLDDLSSSVIDGRWPEQKFRLKSCGAREPMYLVEGMGPRWNSRFGLPLESIIQAYTNAQIVDEIEVKVCRDFDATKERLKAMSRAMVREYSGETLRSCARNDIKSSRWNYKLTFSEFATHGTKKDNFTVSEMFAKHLLQIRGITIRHLTAILDKYPTLVNLMMAYERLDDEKSLSDKARTKAKDQLLMDIELMNGQRIGPKVSKRICTAYTTLN